MLRFHTAQIIQQIHTKEHPMSGITPTGYNTVNPFVFADDATALGGFLQRVFGAAERPEARTIDGDGLVLHSEFQLGDSVVMVVDRKPDWPWMPGTLQVYVADIETTLASAESAGARVITRPTPFFGAQFSRLVDPWSNVWWVYQQDADWSGEEDWTSDASGDGEWESTPELDYIHDTIVEFLPTLSDPRAG